MSHAPVFHSLRPLQEHIPAAGRPGARAGTQRDLGSLQIHSSCRGRGVHLVPLRTASDCQGHAGAPAAPSLGLPQRQAPAGTSRQDTQRDKSVKTQLPSCGVSCYADHRLELTVVSRLTYRAQCHYLRATLTQSTDSCTRCHAKARQPWEPGNLLLRATAAQLPSSLPGGHFVGQDAVCLQLDPLPPHLEYVLWSIRLKACRLSSCPMNSGAPRQSPNIL
jgi:hypothetical protein